MGNNRPSNSQEGQQDVGDMAGFTPASGVWTVDYDEFGNAVGRNRDARQVHHMYNMPGQLLPPPPALSPRGTFVPDTRYPNFPPGPDFTSTARPPAGFTPLENWPDNRPPPFTPNNFTSPAAAPQTPPPTLLHATKREEEAKHWTEMRDANGEKYYMNTLTMERQIETPDCLKKYTIK